ncbi:MAG: hypothetical protein Q7K26_03140 [bacterium]|nr:hypothetical protein [bacterium]
MNETDKLIEEQVKTLPLNLQQAINAMPWKALVQEIGKANALNAEQIASLEQETMFIIYAFESPIDYITNITREVKVTEDVASNVAESVADKIFDPIFKKSEELAKPVSIPPTSAQGSGRAMEIPPITLPMVETGEVAHTVDSKQYAVDRKLEPTPIAPVPKPLPETKPEPKINASVPDYRYQDGKDPYREPLG